MKWPSRHTVYKKASSTSSEDGDWRSTNEPVYLPWRAKYFSLLNLGIFVINTLFLITTLWSSSQQRSPNWQLKQINSYTPLLDQFSFSFSRQRLNASLFNDPYSIYKADPSPEVDAAWDDISDKPVLIVSEKDVRRMGKDPNHASEVPLEFGYGPNKHFAVNDGQHLIDELRKFAFYDYCYSDKFGPVPNATNIPALHSAHRSHCLSVLLNALTCQPSMNMVLWEWMEGEDAPYPDFSIDKKCVNYEAFRGRWRKGGRRLSSRLRIQRVDREPH